MRLLDYRIGILTILISYHNLIKYSFNLIRVSGIHTIRCMNFQNLVLEIFKKVQTNTTVQNTCLSSQI